MSATISFLRHGASRAGAAHAAVASPATTAATLCRCAPATARALPLHRAVSCPCSACLASTAGSVRAMTSAAEPIPEWSNESKAAEVKEARTKEASPATGAASAPAASAFSSTTAPASTSRASSAPTSSARRRRGGATTNAPALADPLAPFLGSTAFTPFLPSIFNDPFFTRDPFFTAARDPFALPQDSFLARHPLVRHWLSPFQSLLSPLTSLAPSTAAGPNAAAIAPNAATSPSATDTALADADAHSRGFWNWESELVNPVSMELDEADHKYVMNVRVPGMSKQDLHVKLEPSGHLRIWGKHSEESNGDDDVQRESASKSKDDDKTAGESKRARGKTKRTVSFERWIALPDTVQLDGIHAKFENDTLSITLPKTEEAKKERLAEIAIE